MAESPEKGQKNKGPRDSGHMAARKGSGSTIDVQPKFPDSDCPLEDDVMPYARAGSAADYNEDPEDENTVSEDEANTEDSHRSGSPPPLLKREGQVWHAQVMPDDYADPKHCTSSGDLKPRRPTPQIRASDFFGQLRQTEDGRWFFKQQLNGWPGLVELELRSVTCKVRTKLGVGFIKRHWDALQSGRTQPSFPAQMRSVRVTLYAPSWTLKGWSEDSPGFAFWAAMQNAGGVKVFHGEDMVRAVKNRSFSNLQGFDPATTTATRVHLFAHRYCVRVFHVCVCVCVCMCVCGRTNVTLPALAVPTNNASYVEIPAIDSGPVPSTTPRNTFPKICGRQRMWPRAGIGPGRCGDCPTDKN